MEERTVDSAMHEFRVDYEQTKNLNIGQSIPSNAFSAGGYMWRVHYFPHGVNKANEGNCISILVQLVSKSRNVNAIWEAFMLDKGGEPCHRTAARSDYLTEGHIVFVCAIMVVRGGVIRVPPPDIKEHFGKLLDSTDGTDVSFAIDGETFHAHRVVLAARSPVFKAKLLGSMVEATMSSITLHGIAPATFRVMLQFMYTDALPGDDELGGPPVDMIQKLLAAADRYALDRLKLICAHKLCDDMSVDTVAATLACAEMYSCSELKSQCIDFFAADDNFKKAVLTKGFVQLVQMFPSIIDELREKVGL
ncbi:hypothetical protein HU200_065768 [Digitaria exilis]|uniref:BTB domain-containing protein n=1 Tax=Digitaria exilis TaxID=1010633 RepID=A0A835DTF5_9POAL|nr:hypothetical protein HU200_065768 [Digitaria exilis]